MRGPLLAALALIVSAPAAAADVARGQRLFDQWCLGCHDRTSPLQPTMPGTTVLAERYGTSEPGALVDRTNLTPDFVKAIVRSGINLMPQFRKTELSDAELGDVAAFLSARKPSALRKPRAATPARPTQAPQPPR